MCRFGEAGLDWYTFPWLLLEGTVFVRAAVMVAVLSAGCVVRGVWREVSRCELGNEDA
jgi:hypothetical protein